MLPEDAFPDSVRGFTSRARKILIGKTLEEEEESGWLAQKVRNITSAIAFSNTVSFATDANNVENAAVGALTVMCIIFTFGDVSGAHQSPCKLLAPPHR
mgnify:CR=1 FL=1